MASFTTSSIRAFLLLSILTFSLVMIPTVRSQDSAFLNKVCSDTSQNFTQESPFAKNLKHLLDNLYNNTPKTSHGFSQASIGQVHGMALCRGDVDEGLCEYCLQDAKCKMTNHCNKKTAMVWFDYCQMKYSDENFLGKIDEDNNSTWINYFNVSGYYNLSRRQTEKFKDSSIGLLSKLAKTATASQYMFAGSQTLFDEKKNITIHGMAQCTRDLSKGNCNECLRRATKQLPIYTGSIYSKGQRVFTASCTVRYETYTFLLSQGSA